MSAVVGSRFVRQDALEKATGAARYLADLTVPGLAHAGLLTAAVPHAKVLRLDVSAARALPGVLAVLTREDVPDVRYGPFVRDRALFAGDRVRFEGEVVAAVAALTPEIAAEACRLVRVDYEPLGPVLADGRQVITVEGLAARGEPAALQRAFVESGGIQCGFCTPGMLVSATALLEEQPDPSEHDVRLALAGNLCRCTGYSKIVDAVLSAAAELREAHA